VRSRHPPQFRRTAKLQYSSSNLPVAFDNVIQRSDLLAFPDPLLVSLGGGDSTVRDISVQWLFHQSLMFSEIFFV
jgi:hypothetical protein